MIALFLRPIRLGLGICISIASVGPLSWVSRVDMAVWGRAGYASRITITAIDYHYYVLCDCFKSRQPKDSRYSQASVISVLGSSLDHNSDLGAADLGRSFSISAAIASGVVTCARPTSNFAVVKLKV